MNRIPPLSPDWKLCSPFTEAQCEWLLFLIVYRLETSVNRKFQEAMLPKKNDLVPDWLLSHSVTLALCGWFLSLTLHRW